nr:immunoglobulin heavy chain junction region [Mus musculus]
CARQDDPYFDVW